MVTVIRVRKNETGFIIVYLKQNINQQNINNPESLFEQNKIKPTGIKMNKKENKQEKKHIKIINVFKVKNFI